MEDRREGGPGSALSSVSSDAQYLSLSLFESITFSPIWFWESRRARVRFTHENSRCIEKNCNATTGVEQHNLIRQNSVFLQSTWWKCFVPLPKNHYSTACLLYNKVLWPKHSIPFTKCKTKLIAQYVFKTYDTYACRANYGPSGSC